ncbi:MAG: leucine-rich repeat domain-containing protein [Propionicimonas sp.]|uniref:leucine-rich repeat domain-containing protein n=1 Tax=Propionicimonas sp. TaxID=1955623 RepID=UPI002B1F10EF|nr:leucine-rich repeat domain-containing protein [Propionicimonas sp.]MEA4943289.1 leucine-rich repeat domain-containing protein [Propionicimonas sp.]
MSVKTRLLAATLVFGLLGLPAPAVAAEPDGIPDPGLRACIARALGVKPAAEFSTRQLAGITSLSCDGAEAEPVGSLTGIGQLTSLDFLTLKHQALADLAPLDGLAISSFSLYRSQLTGEFAPLHLPRLTYISLRGSHVPSLSLLSSLTTVARIDLVGATFPDLAGLVPLTSLEYLSLGYNDDADLTGLAGVSVDEVFFIDHEATSLPNLGQAPAARKLDIYGDKLRDLDGLTGWSTLKELELATPAVTDFSGLSGLTGLTTLVSSNHSLPDLRPVAGLKSLTRLEAVGHGITDLSPLSGLTKLTSLRLEANEIVDLSPLAGLHELTSLWLEGNWITDLSPLAGLTKLTQLAVAGGAITDVRPLKNLTALTTLDLSRNWIQDVSSLKRLTKLETLDLESNWVDDVRPLAALPKSAYLGLSFNRILDLSPLAGHSGELRAARQRAELEEAVFGAPWPVRIAGLDGKLPATTTFTEGASYSGGKLRYTIAGPHHISFASRGNPETAFSGEIRQRVGPDQWFNKPKLRVQNAPVVGATIGARYTTGWKPAPTKVSYQWYRDVNSIPGATGQNYVATTKDVGHRLRVRARASRDGYHPATAWSGYTQKVRSASFRAAPRPTITGSAKTGQKLTVTVPRREPAATTVSYQWYRDAKKIAKATRPSYTLTAADKGRRVSVRVTYKAPGIRTEQMFSKKTAKVTAGPVRSQTPAIAGTVAVGKKVTAKAGSWGPGKVTMRYQWRRDGKAIKGATRSSYRVSTKDAGHELSVTVTGSRKGYRTVTKTSTVMLVPR